VPIREIPITSTLTRTILAAGAIFFLLSGYAAAKWAFANAISRRADVPELSLLATELGPADPQTHFSAAVMLERTFISEDLDRAVREHEAAAALAPNNYLIWLALGRARERVGDAQAGEAAIRRAAELAPNYASVHWALGNNLLRQRRSGEAFEHLRLAAASDPKYAEPLANTAWQSIGGDVPRLLAAVGDIAETRASIAVLLATEKRFDEAAAIQPVIDRETASDPLKAASDKLRGLFMAARRYRAAQAIDSQKPTTGMILNPGFEDPVRVQGATPFEWSMGDGVFPQIARTDGEKHGGRFSLAMIFGSGTKDFRVLSQLVIVEPGKRYALRGFYRSELDTRALFKWEASDGSTVLAASEPLANRTAWQPFELQFTAPGDADGITLRLARENCGALTCSVAGTIWFDDFELSQL
jgi:tetratricopeptide (TPR) repeat protein